MMVIFHSIEHTNMQSWLITDPQNPWAGCLVLYRDAFIIHLVLDVFACGKTGIPHWNTLISEEPEYSSNSNFNHGKVAKLRKKPVEVWTPKLS